jgi:dihydroorotase
LLLLPGAIDVHVHFREPGLEYKADMGSESAAALAGGVTTVFEMPNTNPTTTTIKDLENKILIAKSKMLCNYGFFFGITNDNIDQALHLPNGLACGLKLFLGSSTGNMLVDKAEALDKLFANSQMIISAHCEDETRVTQQMSHYKALYPDNKATAALHPLIRDSKACYDSTSFAVDLAKKYGTKLHIAHLSTERELELVSSVNLLTKRITAEVSPSHLWFSDEDYAEKGNFIKCNPSIKTKKDRNALREALKSNKIDIVATDHAPHSLEEKQKPYFSAPSGIPSIQHSLLTMLELAKKGELTMEQIVEKMAHNPATIFAIEDRGFIREGYYADFVLINAEKQTFVSKDSLFYKCKWSALEGETFSYSIEKTFVNGNMVFDRGKFFDIKGKKADTKF